MPSSSSLSLFLFLFLLRELESRHALEGIALNVLQQFSPGKTYRGYDTLEDGNGEGLTHLRFYPTHRNATVFGAEAIVHLATRTGSLFSVTDDGIDVPEINTASFSSREEVLLVAFGEL